MVRWPKREEWMISAAGAVWAAGFLASEPLTAVVVVPVIAVGLLLHRRHPLTAALIVLAGEILKAVGTAADNPAGIAPAFIVIFTVGRIAPPWRGVLVTGAFLAAVSYADGFAVATVLFAALAFGGAWAFGRVVRHRNEAASAARARADELTSRDPQVFAASVVADERARLARDTVTVIGESVRIMLRDAADAEPGLDAALIVRVQERGRSAVAELRRLLGLLRSGPQPASPPTPVVASKAWSRDVVIAGLIVALGVAELLAGVGENRPHVWILYIVLCASVALRRWVTTTIGVATLCLVAAVILGQPLPYGFAHVIVLVLLAWTAATAGWVAPWLALAGLAAVTIVISYSDDPDNVAMAVAVLAVPAFAGHAWTENEREQRSAESDAASIQQELDRVAAAAVKEERLRVARDLHDLTSHAVGVMVLQAGAAQAQLAADPERARSALRVVQQSGAQALAELSRLVDVLGSDAGLSAPAPEDDLAGSLRALTDRLAVAGLRIELVIGAVPTDAAVASATYRVVQESLTNVVRHAAGSAVEVRLRLLGDAFEVVVRDDGSEHAGGHEAPGFGLVGLGETVGAAGGELVAGPEPDGGFSVTARFASGAILERARERPHAASAERARERAPAERSKGGGGQ